MLDLASSMDWPRRVRPSRFFGILCGYSPHSDALFYDVYTHVSDCHLSEIGVDVDWHDVEVVPDDPEDEGRWGGTRQYFTVPIYRLPIARLGKD